MSGREGEVMEMLRKQVTDLQTEVREIRTTSDQHVVELRILRESATDFAGRIKHLELAIYKASLGITILSFLFQVVLRLWKI